ncbi:SAM-dependent methyltransferase [Clostridium zeae]|uniref:SAM-dependent methyltransferase n=1 Tax=Clostridium zeae TaxID=2759022 RepID=A0ABQ1E4Z4_9CLOT|nr:class I SAM-dependent methyltransferase [Clostridium zeae]GFZ29803.1 SAM-dependent methyltransferase [Clostridium zeae]
MNNEALDIILGCMATSVNMPHMQRIQTKHRVKLAEFWDIKKGSKVLEIGCGQGDTTAILAYMVGQDGFVQGIDIASPSYGAPITVGDSVDYLKNSTLGKQIKIDLEVDVLSPTVKFEEGAFDTIILSHCSWYLKSSEELLAILKKVRKWGKKLCFAEWDTNLYIKDQYPHLLAVLIQSQYECFKENSISNVRTLFTSKDIKEIVIASGWNITNEHIIHSPTLHDGKWEIDMVLHNYSVELENLKATSTKLANLIKSEIDLLKYYIKHNNIEPLSTFALIAE